MTDPTRKDWRERCVAVASENDPKRLESLLQELIRALDDRQSQSQVGTQQIATNW